MCRFSCSELAAEGAQLFPGPDEVEYLVAQPRVGGVDRIHLRHVAVLRQHEAADAAMVTFAEAVLQKIELADERWGIKFGRCDHEGRLGFQQAVERRSLLIGRRIRSEIG